ncbi:aminopeptidase N-like [Malaya genurostris]|uniref:aminopeptidase N-like n=1 Tax=Malaya genurostris TaxID=325434 RepID=UPI0026F39BC5|nr:aminopeptidase N-like [Malaya genurostris]
MVSARSILNFFVVVGILTIFSVVSSATIEELSILDEGYLIERTSEPLSYTLFLDISDENFNSYNGSVDIQMRYLTSKNYFYLNSAEVNIDISSIKVTKLNGAAVELSNFNELKKYEQLYFEFTDNLELNTVYNVHIDFSNRIGTDLKGLYKSSYIVDNSRRHIATTHFQSTYARTVFPCYDEPAYKAYFNVSIRHDSKFHAISNMPVQKTTQTSDKLTTTTTFQQTPLMSSYLLAFIVSDYSTLSNQQDLIRVYAPSNQVQHTTYALNFAEKSLASLEQLFGHDFQLPKVDLVAIPDFNMGAAENWGLITFRAVYLIYDEHSTTARTKQSIANLITHEFVHSWFGNEVTPEWWTYLWLSEGVARFFEYYVTAQIEDTWMLWQQFVVNNVHAALSQDDKNNNRPMSYNATEPDVLNNLFDYVVYAKSASVIRMIQNVIGFDEFVEALNDYITNRSYQTTKPEYLYNSIEKFSNVELPGSISDIFNNWANNPGYPVVTVTKDKNLVTFSQKRFWMPIENEKAPSDINYYIPINYATTEDADYNDTTPMHWLTPSNPILQNELPDSVNWILINKLQTGYYRVNYDQDNWVALTNILRSNQMEDIPVINRAQLIDDVGNLAKAGEVSYEIALTLLQYLEQETEYITWSTAYNVLIHLNRMFSGSDHYSRFEDFVRTVTVNIYKNVGMTGRMDQISRLHRGNTVYLACYFGVKECVDEAEKQVQQMLDDESYTVPEEVQSSAFCAMSKYNEALQTKAMLVLFERYLPLRASESALIGRFITGLGCNRNVTNIGTYLSLTISNIPGFQLTGSERIQILNSVITGSYEGLLESLKFVLKYYTEVASLFSPLDPVFTEFGNRINNNVTYGLLQDIIKTYENNFPDSIKSSASSALIQATQNIGWTAKYNVFISEWLIKNEYVVSTTPDASDPGSASLIVVNIFIIISIMLIVNVFI